MENFYTHSPRSNILTANTLSDVDSVVRPSEIRIYSQIFIWEKNFPDKRNDWSSALGWDVSRLFEEQGGEQCVWEKRVRGEK